MSALSALVDVATERRSQIEAENWTPAHDDEHTDGQLAHAAISYAMWATQPCGMELTSPPAWWPWENAWWKPKDVRRDLVRAAALLLAEIERLDRSALPQEGRHE